MTNRTKNKSNLASKKFIVLGIAIPVVIAFLVICCVVGFIVYCIFMLTVPKMTADNFFNKLEMEAATPSFAYYDAVHFDDEIVYLDDYLIEDKQELLQVFAVDNEIIYFAYESWENDDWIWNIAKVDITKGQMETLCSENFDDPKNYNYIICFGNEYSERNGYYLDGKIVLTDFSKLLEYTIADNSYIVTDYENYQFPSFEIKGEVIDGETIRFETADGEKILKLSEAASNSKALSEIYALKDKKDWDGESYIQKFFHGIEVIDDKIYIYCIVQNYAGEGYTVILNYNPESNSCDYAGYCFTSEWYLDDLYLISG